MTPEQELIELRKYARNATVMITNLTCGGSEYFGKRIGDVYTADLKYCDEVIRKRMQFAQEEKLNYFRNLKQKDT